MSSQTDKPIKCTKCEGFSFNTQEELKQHDREHHS